MAQGLNSLSEEPPLLWAIEVVSEPIVQRLRHHFVGNANTDRIEHPEWLFETVRKVAASLAPQLDQLASYIQVQSCFVHEHPSMKTLHAVTHP